MSLFFRNTVTFLTLLLTTAFCIPLPQEITSPAPTARADPEPFSTSAVVSVAANSVDADFTLFEPVVLETTSDSQDSSQMSIPVATVTRIITATITPPPATLISWVTATPSSSPVPSTTTLVSSLRTTMTTPPPTPTVSRPSPTGSSPTSWSLGAQFTDLGCFNVQKYAGGESNIRVVTGIPVAASFTAPSPQSTPLSGVTSWNNATDNAMQLFFPKGSVNPGNRPQGGSDFYATPLPLDHATNVTMEYSVFMDENMDFVKGGKLPGLYGGHQGCSGGNVADTCFSTRLMWRPEGAGELYLYAEKAKQPPSLCQTANASCNEVYGLSLGRGSFTFARGTWTNLRQTVRLNTPGIPDGVFTLDVNGKRVLSLGGIYYRDSKPSSSTSSSSSALSQGGKTTHSMAVSTMSQGPSSTAMPSIPPEISDVPPMTPSAILPPLLGGILGGLGDLLGGSSSTGATPGGGGLFGGQAHKRTAKEIGASHRRHQRSERAYAMSSGPVELIAPRSFRVPKGEKTKGRRSLPLTFRDGAVPAGPPGNAAIQKAEDLRRVLSAMSYVSSIPEGASGPSASFGPAVLAARSVPAFGFTGIFFSTFFGGHDPSWATPKDQYMWFKGFALTINT